MNIFYLIISIFILIIILFLFFRFNKLSGSEKCIKITEKITNDYIDNREENRIKFLRLLKIIGEMIADWKDKIEKDELVYNFDLTREVGWTNLFNKERRNTLIRQFGKRRSFIVILFDSCGVEKRIPFIKNINLRRFK